MEGPARDVRQIFGEKIDSMASLVREGMFRNAHRVSLGLTRISAHSEFRMGVFAAKTLEGAFGDVGPLFEHYSIPDPDKAEVKGTISSHLGRLKAAYGEGNDADIYRALADLRFAITMFQIKCAESYAVNPEHDMRRPFRMGVQ